ncbi:outer membrane lipid asymmetry maintenance protein MlaD [Desulforhabdus amnigena]|jgi:phospholipid/cholesterol/gamma-HCH transport system substrate-binding protein|uniref:Outer membrane lipid asymmetry maintenance protein MlaD n=1 Tax=Desulforhabdus amnigena TaxID=40218 RepID=A0A9W6CUF8_9BACT|nr:outer membrane lipid asymmetry maintenance protein MlaD [Desulforhabdus amnigena]NLJ29732.1 outer membrane lipid asymmetry maintenance protein MlaD [Deltaproteobacteria bacterium]GLI32669.1 outer membrane lipid asymmetry maintenance protein MlaD [Desulforhabdus amnigena]
MYKTSTEIIVGIFVLLGVACIAYLSVSLGEVDLFGNPYYRVSAEFNSITGLKKGSTVEIAGVEVGKVLDISLDSYMAKVTMGIRKDIKLSDDTIASVRTKGIIGDMFIKLSPGGSSEMLEPGGVLVETESAISLEELISKYIFESK